MVRNIIKVENQERIKEKNSERLTILISEGLKKDIQTFVNKHNFSTTSIVIRDAIRFYLENYISQSLISNLNHEIKDSLTSIKGFSQILVNEYWNKVSLDIVLKIKEIHDQSIKLEKNIFKLLNDEKGENEIYDILIVEEEPSITKVLLSYFKIKGYKCKSVSLGVEAIRVIHKSPPKVVLLDTSLPDINGYEICKTIKANQDIKKIPVFFITSDSQSKLVENLRDSGAEGYFLKPFDFKEFDILFDYIINR